MFTDNFLSARRAEFYDDDGNGYIKKITYTYTIEDDDSGTVYEADAKIQDCSFTGNYIVFTLLLAKEVYLNITITSVILYGDNPDDEDSEEYTAIATKSTSISVNASQSVMVVFKILYQEVDSSDE